EEVGGTVGSGREPLGTQADRPADLGSEGSTPTVMRPNTISVAVPLRVRTPQDRADVRRAVAACEGGALHRSAWGIRGGRGPEGREGAGGVGGQRGLAPGADAGGAGQRGAALPAAVYARVATGRALVAVGAGGRGESVDRADRPAQEHRSRPRGLLGQQPRRGSAPRRLPMGRFTRTVTFQHDSV